MAAYKLGVTENRFIYNLNQVNISKNDSNQIHIILNGIQLEFDQAPIIVESRTLVPMRAVFEALGAAVFWNDTLKEATGTLGDQTVLIRIGSKTAAVNGVATTLDVPAQIVSSRTLVPIRFIAESLNAVVDWNPVTRTVYIEKKD
ncbi:MAG: copper amine oxidase N-terminal domain-containing protein [Peptostreptococcaceae bacterium]|nr:copper amine oxidase N-terminal domain-containing protein [Peptostreptococcaceae bacterium]